MDYAEMIAVMQREGTCLDRLDLEVPAGTPAGVRLAMAASRDGCVFPYQPFLALRNRESLAQESVDVVHPDALMPSFLGRVPVSVL